MKQSNKTTTLHRTLLMTTLAFSFVLFSFAVETEKPKSTTHSAEPTLIEETMVETDIQLEDWMVDLNSWDANSVDLEDEIALEEWMLTATNDYWNAYLEVDKEDDIELEDWMTDLTAW